MIVCAVIWLWVGFAKPLGEPDGKLFPFTLPRLLVDSQFGLTFVVMVIGSLGYLVWRWGSGPRQ